MPSFAIIAEGATDQAVIENILKGFFGGDEDPVVNYVHPPPSTSRDPAPGGWTLVLRSLRAADHRKALQLNDYVVIHIDTDVSEEKGYDVPRALDGQPLTPEQLIEQVKNRLIDVMGRERFEPIASRVVFAIAVDSIECWLLPLLYDGDPPKKKAKTTGCLGAADRKLRRLGRATLSKSDDEKLLASYEAESKGYRRYKVLMQHRAANPSLDVFAKNLEALEPPPTPPKPTP